MASQLTSTHVIGEPGHDTLHNEIDSRGAFKFISGEAVQAGWVRVNPANGDVLIAQVAHTTGATPDLTKWSPAGSATYVPKWQPNTAYTAGQFVLNPLGLVVSAKVAFTSGATYDATNWNVTSTGGSGALGAKNLKSDYGAKGDGRFQYDMTTTSGSSTVGSTAYIFSAADIGKTVAVYSSVGAQLVIGTVGSISAGKAVLTGNGASATATGSGLFGCFGTDDTATLQAAADAQAQGGPPCYVPFGLYVIAGAMQSATVGSQTYTGQVLVQGRDIGRGIVPITFFGDQPAGGIVNGESIAQDPQPLQAGFFSTAMSGWMFSGRGTTANDSFAAAFSATARWSEQYLTMRNLSFRAPIDPGVSLVRGDTFACCEINDCDFNVQASGDVISTTGFTRGGTALTLSSQFNQTKVGAHGVQISGFTTGLTHSEHASLDQVGIELCAVGIAVQDSPNGFHAAYYGRVLVQQCQVNLQNRSGQKNVMPLVGTLLTEAGGANGLPTPLCHIDDPNDFFIGQLVVATANFGSNAMQSAVGTYGILNKGARSLRITNLRDGTSTVTQTTVSTPTGGVTGPRPNAPTIGSATAGAGSASITFTPPASGQTPSSYTATSTPGGLTGTSTGSPVTVSGLTNGTAYTFTVRANFNGASSQESAASNSVTPTIPAGSTVVSENGTHPDGTLSGTSPQTGPAWRTPSSARSLSVASNKIVQQAYSANTTNGNYTDAGTIAYTAELTFTVGSNAARCNPSIDVLCGAAGLSGLACMYDGGTSTIGLYRRSANTAVTPVSVTQLAAGTSHKIKVVVGSTVDVYLDNSLKLSYTPVAGSEKQNGFTGLGPTVYQNSSADDGSTVLTAFTVTAT